MENKIFVIEPKEAERFAQSCKDPNPIHQVQKRQIIPGDLLISLYLVYYQFGYKKFEFIKQLRPREPFEINNSYGIKRITDNQIIVKQKFDLIDLKKRDYKKLENIELPELYEKEIYNIITGITHKKIDYCTKEIITNYLKTTSLIYQIFEQNRRINERKNNKKENFKKYIPIYTSSSIFFIPKNDQNEKETQYELNIIENKNKNRKRKKLEILVKTPLFERSQNKLEQITKKEVILLEKRRKITRQ